MTAYNNMDIAFPGLLVGMENEIESAVAGEAIEFGHAVFGHADYEGVVWEAHQDQATMTLDADLVASNVITTTVNGTAVATTYDGTSHATTMTAHIAALNADATIAALGITFAAGSTNRIIVATVRGLDITMTSVVTLGATRANASTAYTTWAKFMGIATHTHKSTVAMAAGASNYAQYDAVNVLSKGQIWVEAASTVDDKDAAYVVYLSGSTQEDITDVSTNNYDIGGYFRSSYSGGFAILEVRGMK